MIWICSICLLLLALWFFFNALNERRWVEAHSHDETVASDKGLLPNFSSITGSGVLASDRKFSLNEENSPFARAVEKVRQTTGDYGDKFLQAKANAARINDPDQRPGSAGEENTLFGRTVARVSKGSERIEQKLKSKLQNVGADGSGTGESAMARASRKVISSSEAVGQKVADRARKIAQGSGDGFSASDENGMFSKVVSGVSSSVKKIESKIDSTVKNARGSKENSEDLVTRVAAKVDDKVNQLDGKNASTAGEKATETIDR